MIITNKLKKSRRNFMAPETDYTTVRIQRKTKHDIERIAAIHYTENGEKLDAGQVVEKAIEFLMSLVSKDGEKKG